MRADEHTSAAEPAPALARDVAADVSVLVIVRLFTVGYQGLGLGDFVALLDAAGAGAVLDVREAPWSRKPGFSKRPLESALVEAGIGYLHVRSAGNPSEIRKGSAATTAEVLALYAEYLDRSPDCLDELLVPIRAADAAGRPACLLCFEREPRECHRSVIVETLARVEPRLVVTHLRTDPHQQLSLLL